MSTQFTDGGGRVLVVTDPLNYPTAYSYDNLNQLAKVVSGPLRSVQIQSGTAPS